MRTAVLERTNIKFQSERYAASEVHSEQAIQQSISKLYAFIRFGACAIVLACALVGALNAYATNLEIKSSQTNSEIMLFDERIREFQDFLDSGYNGIFMQAMTTSEYKSNDKYFVKAMWEVGG